MSSSAEAGEGERVALSFHDSLLRRCDLDLLRGCGWLNDRLIGFYFEYLERVRFKNYASKVCFLTPDVAQFVKLHQGDPAELELFLEPLFLHAKDLVLLPVNNNQSAQHAGGSHWSLLVYWRPANAFEYYDSAGYALLGPAKQCFTKLIHFLRVKNLPTFEEVDCPKQENSYDCGVYVLMFAERLCQVKLQGEPVSLLSTISANSITKLRTDILTLIHSLSK